MNTDGSTYTYKHTHKKNLLSFNRVSIKIAFIFKKKLKCTVIKRSMVNIYK